VWKVVLFLVPVLQNISIRCVQSWANFLVNFYFVSNGTENLTPFLLDFLARGSVFRCAVVVEEPFIKFGFLAWDEALTSLFFFIRFGFFLRDCVL